MLHGVVIFQTFPQREELLRNMMGLLGNVAEVQVLRQRLMTSQFVSVFADLLDAGSEGIEVNSVEDLSADKCSSLL
jgi:Zyg-11 family protein